MVAYLTIDFDAFTGDDAPPISRYSAMTLRPGDIHVGSGKVNVGDITIRFAPEGKPVTVNGAPVTGGLVPVLPGVTYAVHMPSILTGAYTLGPLVDGTTTNLADVLVPGAPLTPDQASALQAQIDNLDTSGLGDMPDLTLLYTAART